MGLKLDGEPFEDRGRLTEDGAFGGGELGEASGQPGVAAAAVGQHARGPDSVSDTTTWRPSVSWRRRRTWPPSSRQLTVRVIDGGWTRSSAASSPTVSSPLR